jgi:DNA-binding LytR/AlgR family response regulator
MVEDDPLFIASMRALLVNAGYSVAATTSSADASIPQMVQAADLVMLDLSMPGKDGFELLREIRQSPETATKPVLLLTAHDPMTYKLKGLSLGADDYVIKPPNRDELLLRIAGLLRRCGCTAPAEPPDAGSKVRVDNPRGGHRFVNAAEVTYIEAARNYSYVHTRDGRQLSSANISQLEEQLGDSFARIHRSYLVNLACVRSARWESNSSYVLDLDDSQDTVLPVGRAYRSMLRQALGIAERAS